MASPNNYGSPENVENFLTLSPNQSTLSPQIPQQSQQHHLQQSYPQQPQPQQQPISQPLAQPLSQPQVQTFHANPVQHDGSLSVFQGQQQRTTTEPGMSELQLSMASFMTSLDQRMARLEHALFYVQRQVEDQSRLFPELHTVLRHISSGAQQLKQGTSQFLPIQPSPQPQNVVVDPSLVHPTQQQFVTSVPSHPNTPQPQLPQLQQQLQIQAQPEGETISGPALSLRFRDFTEKWFTDRPFPPFSIDVIENATGEVYRKTHDWKVTLSLYDGNGNEMSDRMGDVDARNVILKEGTAEVLELKFVVVSSKHGNFFNIVAEVTEPAWVSSFLTKFISPNFVVLSCRLFHNPKRQIEDLSADDQLSRMPGIGRLYAERFAAAGITTIRKLSTIPLGPNGRPTRSQLLNHLRRDKGTMTETKLVEYVEKAKEIVLKSDQMTGSNGLLPIPSTNENNNDNNNNLHHQLNSSSSSSSPGSAQMSSHLIPSQLSGSYDEIQSTTEENNSNEPNAKRIKIVHEQGHDNNHHHHQDYEQSYNLDVDDFLNYTDEIPQTPQGSTIFTPGISALNFHLSASDSVSLEGWDDGSSDSTTRAIVNESKSSTNQNHNNHSHFHSHSHSHNSQSPLLQYQQPSKGVIKPNIEHPLHHAIGTKKLTLVKNVVAALREGNLPISEENDFGYTPLMLACAIGDTAMVEYFCSLPEVSVSQQSSKTGATPLHIAAYIGKAPVVLTLLKQPGIDASLSCTLKISNFTPLMLAVLKGNTPVVEILSKLSASYQVNPQSGVGYYHLAALSGNLDVINLIHNGLLSYCSKSSHSSSSSSSIYGSLVWSQEQDHESIPSILHCASFAGNPQIIVWLLNHGVKPDVVNEEGWTPLHTAAYCGHSECVSILCSKIPVNSQTKSGWTALSLAAMANSENSKQTIEILLAAGATEGAIPANIISISTGNLKALEALSKGSNGLQSKCNVPGIGEMNLMEVSNFFGNASELEILKSKLQKGENENISEDEINLNSKNQK